MISNKLVYITVLIKVFLFPGQVRDPAYSVQASGRAAVGGGGRAVRLDPCAGLQAALAHDSVRK